jgi:hypothetical protein
MMTFNALHNGNSIPRYSIAIAFAEKRALRGRKRPGG